RPWLWSAAFFLGLGAFLSWHEHRVWLPDQPVWPAMLRDSVLEWGAFVPITPLVFAAVRALLARAPGARLAAGLGAVLVVATVIHGLLEAGVVELLGDHASKWHPKTLGEALYRQLVGSSPNDALRYAGVIAVALALEMWRAADRRAIEAREAQLQVLRAQLRPHFLFNTLHAIGVTAQSEPETAARMVTLLGDLLRSVIDVRETQLVSLREELALLRPYLEILSLRYHDRLTVSVDVPADLQVALVPDLLLQPLVENAVRHGIEARAGAGRIEIVGRRDGASLELAVSDDGAGAPPAALDGTGLGNTRARLRALFGGDAELRLAPRAGGGTTATVRLPYRVHGPS
ncbi:MAG TPA: histidine kinase, partial [Planctomycetota bacterium]|nr:histidine kinase [Planctomycetota bacterium]